MIESYKEYLTLPKAMTLEKMQELHEAMISEIGSDSDAVELYEELLATAGRYAAIRAGWSHLSREEKMDQDSRRTSCHNSVITHFIGITYAGTIIRRSVFYKYNFTIGGCLLKNTIYTFMYIFLCFIYRYNNT